MIRKATPQDIPQILNLLKQVAMIHHQIRPDLFKECSKKYDTNELEEIMKDENRPILVATINDEVVGYAFCMFIQHFDHSIFTDIKTLYIDDLCVDETKRGYHIGSSLYNKVVEFAKENDCYNITLNVWAGNDSAKSFYESVGLKPQKYGLEKILK